MPTATALFVDGPCRLRKRQITFDVQPPEFLDCGGANYTYSVNQGLEYLNYVVKGGVNDVGAVSQQPRRDMFRAFARINLTVNKTLRTELLRTRHAGRRARRAVR